MAAGVLICSRGSRLRNPRFLPGNSTMTAVTLSSAFLPIAKSTSVLAACSAVPPSATSRISRFSTKFPGPSRRLFIKPSEHTRMMSLGVSARPCWLSASSLDSVPPFRYNPKSTRTRGSCPTDRASKPALG